MRRSSPDCAALFRLIAIRRPNSYRVSGANSPARNCRAIRSSTALTIPVSSLSTKALDETGMVNAVLDRIAHGIDHSSLIPVDEGVGHVDVLGDHNTRRDIAAMTKFI